MLIYILFIIGIYSYDCSPGCSSSCVSDGSCEICKDEYYQDSNCNICQNINPHQPISDTNPLFIKRDGVCQKFYNVYQKSNWIPSNDIIPFPFNSEPLQISFNSSTLFDVGPCTFSGNKQNQYRPAKWLKLDTTGMTKQVVDLLFTFKSESKVNVYYDLSDSSINTIEPHCLIKGYLSQNDQSNHFKFPVPNQQELESPILYLFLSLNEMADVSLEISFTETSNEVNTPFFSFDNTLVQSLYSSHLTTSYTFPMYSKGEYIYPICAPGRLMKVMFFETEFKGDFSLLLDSTKSNRYVFLEEYSKTSDGLTNKCVNFWKGENFGVLATRGKDEGLTVRIEGGNELSKRYFALLSSEDDIDIQINLKTICPNGCYYNSSQGTCSVRDGKCLCKEGYGGDNCVLKCWYNNLWQPSGNTGKDQCYFGIEGCNSTCQCIEGYSLKDHYCISTACSKNEKGKGVECFSYNNHCLANCKCQDGYNATSLFTCVTSSCGNGINDNDEEECDGGEYCTEECLCEKGYKTDSSDKTRCISKTLKWYYHLVILIAVMVGVMLIIICIVLLVIFTRKRKNDFEIYKKQQPQYYLYLGGSVNSKPLKENKYSIFPTDLDYGNEGVPTEVFDTRFEEIIIKNKSRNKYMMIIVHTPDNPKYVFHFSPQVTILSPKSQRIVTSYMTLKCTTKIKDMKIPYSVWFSKKKKVLLKISQILLNKTFESWTQDDQKLLDSELKYVIKRYHHFFIIKTDAASSTHLDMDELNMSENPIAEGATSKVYIGKYRSIPVAIKMFKWENLTEEQTIDLKQEVINECELMSKLRNPFIASYMGSVTYIPQISMVMQYFVLGSLGEYVRYNKDTDIYLPYKLKIKMLFDTARGMQFLHENRIVHLDLKPDNLLVNSLYFDSACCIKITDFGTSRITEKNKIDGNDNKGLGTPVYLAPECYEDDYSFAGDVFAFAITSWELYYQEEPYKDFKSLFQIKEFVKSGKRLPLDDSMPSLFKELIQECWKQNKGDRLNFEQVSQRLVKIIDDEVNHPELDTNTYADKIEDYINTRSKKLDSLLTLD
ncbi:serine-threonine protein kinase, putative [Entamoeba dispar SAW760]|uniref:Serine-threonine protein kinase, putative n=1 Tax=Entamoeba dispar (strain ATCC PRA-260 / SAW760) TaxID=370354 RepID=B0EUD3_ENTDS|nr:serine-threonine protein kinase, putative [Entamoeba dispar SAW760]EDR21858.1 serine-threonine protein kinase, putative [Entamoeba dispar SAW760]|eukprot:EDR21858.1 serine-threonine protein kinase, putative [Entamoeba dispar SAW760]